MVDIVRARAAKGSLMGTEDGFVFSLDANISETHAESSDLTKHPVEQGADIADHVQSKPTRVTIEAMISNAPLEGQLQGGEEIRQSRDVDAWETLISLIRQGEVLQVFTTLKDYGQLVLVSVTTDRNAGQGQAIRPVLELEEVRFAVPEEVQIPASLIKEQEKGRQILKILRQHKCQKAKEQLREIAADSFEVGELRAFEAIAAGEITIGEVSVFTEC